MWEAICRVLRHVSASAAADPIKAVSFSAMGEAFMPVNAAGEFLHNCIVSPDTRAVEQAARGGGKVLLHLGD